MAGTLPLWVWAVIIGIIVLAILIGKLIHSIESDPYFNGEGEGACGKKEDEKQRFDHLNK
jgi:hypothetical protein